MNEEAAREEARKVARQETRQSVALTILASLAVIVVMYLARALLFPIVLSFLLALTFRPVVRTFQRRGIPPMVSSAMVLVTVLGCVALGIVYLVEPAKSWIEDAPEKMQVVGKKLSSVRSQLTQLQQMSAKLEEIAEGKQAAAEPPPRTFWEAVRTNLDPQRPVEDLKQQEPIAVEVKQPQLVSGLEMLNSAGSVLAAGIVVVMLGFFLLASGDRLLNNVLHTLETFREKRLTVELIYNVERGISRYLLTVTCINVCLGIAVGFAMWGLGLPNPALWGLMAAVFNFIPFLGAWVGTAIIFLVSVVTFDSLAYAVVPPVVFIALTSLEGNLITPSVLGRSMRLNPIVVFLSLVFWGWMWGIGGALVAVPLLAVFKVTCDQFEKTQALGTLCEG